MLADSWEISPDLTTWTWHLRKGVPFHKGFGDFTSKDMVHTNERHSRDETTTSYTGFYRDQVVPYTEVVDDYTLIYRLPEARLDLDYIESSLWYQKMLSKEHFDAEAQEGVENNPIGTGPYQFVERVLGSYVLYERVPYQHWRVTPSFRELQIFFVKENSTRLAMLLAGEVHITRLPPDLETTAVNRGMEVISSRIPVVPLYTMYGGVFHDYPVGTRKGESPDLPFSDVPHPVTELPWVDRRVREALNRAVNREEIQATLLGGKGEPMPVPFFHSSLPGWNPQWLERYDEMYGYDPERARELLAEVEEEIGQPLDWSGTIFVLTPRPALPQLVDVGEAINNYWRAVGVDIKLQEMEFATFVPAIIEGRMGGIAWTDGTRRMWDPDMLKTIYYSGRDLYAHCCHFFESDVIDELYEKLVPETDFNIRDQILREAGNYIYDQYVTVPLFFLNADATVNPAVVKDYPTSGWYGTRDLEYVVPTSN
jgi:ABC-type transport system substrate-binding protein